MSLSMEEVEAVKHREYNWILSELAASGDPAEGREVHVELDESGIPTIFVLAPNVSPEVKERIRNRVPAPLKFVEINIQPW
jgi:hypothetical protein